MKISRFRFVISLINPRIFRIFILNLDRIIPKFVKIRIHTFIFILKHIFYNKNKIYHLSYLFYWAGGAPGALAVYTVGTLEKS